MTESPMLSMIIPVYNGEKYLSEAVNSVLRQPCRDFEIIIVNDGSMDSSGAIADRFAAEYENIHAYHIPNGGVSVARNLGIEKAQGQYIAFLDADDVLCKNAYSEDLHTELAAEQYDIFSFSYIKGLSNLSHGCMRSAKEGFFPREDEAYIRQLQKHFCSYLYRRSIFTDRIRFPEGIRYHEDVAFLYFIGRSARNMIQFSSPWFIYRMNFASAMHNLKKAEYILEEIEAWEWCKKNSITPKDRNDCDGNIFSYMVEYIKRSCRYGVAAELIQDKVMTCKPFLTAMKNYGNFWLNKKTDAFYQGFMKNPRKHWVKQRFIGLFYVAGQKFIRTRLGSIADRLLRYRRPLADYLVEYRDS